MKHCSESRYKPASKSKKDKEETTAIFTPPNSDADIDATFQRKEAQSGIEIENKKEEESKLSSPCHSGPLGLEQRNNRRRKPERKTRRKQNKNNNLHRLDNSDDVRICNLRRHGTHHGSNATLANFEIFLRGSVLQSVWINHSQSIGVKPSSHRPYDGKINERS